MIDESRLTLSMSILLAEHPLAARPAAAAKLGYRSVESWWPWAEDEADMAEIEDFAVALREQALDLHLLNVTQGAGRFGGRGLAGIPEAGEEFWANAESVLAVVGRTHARYINVLAGNVPAAGRPVGIDTLLERGAALADRAALLGAGILIEQLNPIDHPDHLLVDPELTADVVLRIRDRSKSSNVGMLADVYHLGQSDVDPVAFVTANSPVIHHVQLADAPGRGRPGTGTLPILATIRALEANGYSGRYGLEYLPEASGALLSPSDFWRELQS